MPQKTGRRIFFWILVFLFSVTSATVLFVTFGYSFDRERGIFVHTGSFTLKVTPIDEAVIQIDGKVVSARKLNILNNAFHIGGQKPGEHMIEVSAPGYFPWKKKATVESGRSTEFWNINLIAENYSKKIIETGEKNLRIFPSPKNNILAIVSEKTNGTRIRIFDTESGTMEEAGFIENAFFDNSSEENLEWSTDLNFILIPLSTENIHSYHLIDTEGKTTENISEQTSLPDIRFARWDGKKKNKLYFLSDTTLYEWNINKEAPSSPQAISSLVSGYDISQNSIYFLNSDTGYVSRIRSGDEPEKKELVTKKAFSHSEEAYALTVYDEDRIALRGRSSGKLIIHNTGESDFFKEIATGVRGVQFSNDGKKLLYFTDREIFTYFVRAWSTQPARSENEIIQIARFSDSLSSTQWTKDYEHVLFSVGNIIKSIELDDRDRRIAETVFSFTEAPEQLLVHFPSDGIFLIERSGDLSYFSFPENLETPNIVIPGKNAL